MHSDEAGKQKVCLTKEPQMYLVDRMQSEKENTFSLFFLKSLNNVNVGKKKMWQKIAVVI